MKYNSGKDNTCRLAPDSANLLKMGRYLAQAILLEVCAHPKPGLVTRCGNGSHRDMSIFTFAMSSAVLAEAFAALLRMGAEHTGTPAQLFAQARIYGRAAERELLASTQGVNTQRGILFAGGVLSAAAGYAAARGLGGASLPAIIREMASGLVSRELEGNKGAARTAGELLYRKYGITGIRGEVERGFPSVLRRGLPALEKAFDEGASLNDALVHALLQLMTVAEDSNVVWRAGLRAADEVKATAAAILARGSVFTPAGRLALAEAQSDFAKRRVSPGGSADLLSVTISLYLLGHGGFPTAVI